MIAISVPVKIPDWRAVAIQIFGFLLCVSVTLWQIEQVWPIEQIGQLASIPAMDHESLTIGSSAVSDFLYEHGDPRAATDNPKRFANLRQYLFWDAVCGDKCAAKASPIFAAFVTLYNTTNANARPGHGGAGEPPLSGCAQPLYTNSIGVTDGCDTAPAGTPNGVTLIQHSDCFTGYCNQSSQSYATRPVWNVSGVDYGEGVPASTVFLDPAVASLPTGCTYSATGSRVSTPQITCNNISGISSFNNMDFSGTLVGSHAAVFVFVRSGSGTIQCYNCYVKWDTVNSAGNLGANNNGGACGFSGAIFWQCHPGQAQWDIEYTTTDSVHANVYTTTIAPFNFQGPSTAGTNKLFHDVFLWTASNPLAGNAPPASWDIRYVHVEGFAFCTEKVGPCNPVVQGHGEMISDTGTGSTKPHVWYYFPFIMQLPQASGGGTTTMIWVSDGTHTTNTTYSDAQVRNATLINNVSSDGSGKAVSASMMAMDGIQTQPIEEDNYFDLENGFYYNIVGATCSNPLTISGNVEMTTNTAKNTFTPNPGTGC